MATFQFYGTGDPISAFNIDNVLVNKRLLPGELRLRSPFPYATLEMWRRAALQYSASAITTGTSDIATRGRTALIFAHDADLGAIFLDLVGNTAQDVAGYYVDKLTAQAVDKLFATALTQRLTALKELAEQSIPQQYIDLLDTRLQGVTFTQRVAGLCASVYLTSILLAQANQ